MSVQSEITRLSDNVTAALAAIADKGVTVPDGSNSDSLASLIAAIEAGGGGGNFDFSNFLSSFQCAASGSFTPSSTTKSVECIHNLGVKPKFIFVCSPFAEILDNTTQRKAVSIFAYQTREDITLNEEKLYAHQAAWGGSATTASTALSMFQEYIIGDSNNSKNSSSTNHKYLSIYDTSSGYYNSVNGVNNNRFILEPRQTNSYYKYFIAGATYYWFALA